MLLLSIFCAVYCKLFGTLSANLMVTFNITPPYEDVEIIVYIFEILLTDSNDYFTYFQLNLMYWKL